MRVLVAAVLLASAPAAAAPAGPPSLAGLLKADVLERLARPAPKDGAGLESLAAEVSRRLAALEQAAPQSRGPIEELRAKTLGLRRGLEGEGSPAPGADACAQLPARSAQRASCLLEGLRGAVAALRVEPAAPARAGGGSDAAVVSAPAGAIPALTPAALAERPGVSAQMEALKAAFTTRAPETFTAADARAELTREARAAGRRRFYQGALGARELPSAVRRFQEKNGLEATGSLDAATKTALARRAQGATLASMEMPQQGDSGERVGVLQRLLRAVDPGLAVDNLFGERTRDAFCRYMSERGWGHVCGGGSAAPPDPAAGRAREPAEPATPASAAAEVPLPRKRPIVGEVPSPETRPKRRLRRPAPVAASKPEDLLTGIQRGAAEVGDTLRRAFALPPGARNVADTLRKLSAMPADARAGADPRALELLAKYFDQEGDHVTNTRTVAVVDASTKRMHIVDVDKVAVDPNRAVTTLPTAVSPRGISATAPKHTELGVYVTAYRQATGGRVLGPIPVLQLQGQTPPGKRDIAGNLRAWNAGILIHSNEILKRGRHGLRRVKLALDRSNGCFHIAEKDAREVIDRLKGGAVVLAYHPTLLPDAAIERSGYRPPAN